MPDWREDLRARLASLRLHPAREAEIIEELSQDLEHRYQELCRGGAGDAEARRLVLDELLEPDALANYLRPLRLANQREPVTPGAPRRSVAHGIWQDLRYSTRMLKKDRGFTAAAVLTLALGIGANSAIFSLVDATLLRSLPFPDPDRLVMLREATETSARERVSPLNMLDWKERSRTVETIGGFVPNVGGMVMPGADGTADTVSRQWVTWGIFDALGITPVAGRTFRQSDDTGGIRGVVITESFWRTRFDRDPEVIGRDIRLDGQPWTILGVVPDEAQVIGRSQMWALVRIHGLPARVRGQYSLHAIARLKPDTSRKAAGADLAAVAADLAREFPGTNRGRGITLEPLGDVVIGGELRQTSLLFLGVVGFVLLICCANVAGLLLTRATVRRRELAVRSALGADRPRLVRQLLTESLVLSVIGGALGVVLGAGILNVAPSVVPQEMLPSTVALAFDARVVAFCAVTAVAIGLTFGLAPAWQATGFSSAQVIASSGRTVTGQAGWLRNMLVIGQVATAVVVLVAAGLLLRTLLAIDRVDRGYGASGVLTMLVDPLSSTYPTDEAELQFYDAVEQEIRALPRVQDVAWATTIPMGPSYFGAAAYEIVGDARPADPQLPTADYQIVSPTYFRALDIPLVEGRPFDDRDRAPAVPVCIVNEAFVRAHFHGRSPIGRHVSIRFDDGPDAKPQVREIVGVARQVKGRSTETEDFVQIYVPLAQFTPGDVFLLVRSDAGRAAAIAPAVRAAIGRVDTQQLVSVRDVRTLDDVVGEATARHRFRAVLVVAFAGLALLLAMVGVFGILAYNVQQRVRDFGVRRAFGATTRQVLSLVAGDATRVIATGAAIGLVVSAATGQVLSSMLFGVQPFDIITFALVGAVIAVTGILSSLGPAWRAARIDPVVALRTE